MRAGCEQRSEERYEYSAFSARRFAPRTLRLLLYFRTIPPLSPRSSLLI